MNKYIFSIVVLGVFVVVLGVHAQTSTTSTTSATSLILQLQTQIKALQSQLQTLQEAQQQVQTTQSQIKTTLALVRNLREGMSGDDVRLLQEALATDPAIYPEGLVTGYFGPLTAKAVRNFQKKANIEQVGQVGPQTRAKLNEIFVEGAGNSGKVPPGLLIAPGIAKKLGFVPQPLPGQVLPPGIANKLPGLPPPPPPPTSSTTSVDTVAPVISDLTAVVSTTSTVISWTTNELTNKTLYYGTSSPLDFMSVNKVVDLSFATSHSVMLGSLSASTSYNYVVVAKDVAGNTATSSQQSFLTP